jgi:hypothetical protein
MPTQKTTDAAAAGVIILIAFGIGLFYFWHSSPSENIQASPTFAQEAQIHRQQQESAAGQATQAAGTVKKVLDYSQPIYTKDYATVCPISLALDRLSARGGMRAYEDASLSMFNRSEKFARLGCQEWHGGVRVYAKKMETPETDIRIVSIRLSSADTATLFTSEYELRN